MPREAKATVRVTTEPSSISGMYSMSLSKPSMQPARNPAPRETPPPGVWRWRSLSQVSAAASATVDVEIEVLVLDGLVLAVCADRLDRRVEHLAQVVLTLAQLDARALAGKLRHAQE